MILLGWPATRPFQDVALALRQRGDPSANLGALGLDCRAFLRAVERSAHRRQEDVVVERLFEEIDGAAFHRLDRERQRRRAR